MRSLKNTAERTDRDVPATTDVRHRGRLPWPSAVLAILGACLVLWIGIAAVTGWLR